MHGPAVILELQLKLGELIRPSADARPQMIKLEKLMTISWTRATARGVASFTEPQSRARLETVD